MRMVRLSCLRRRMISELHTYHLIVPPRGVKGELRKDPDKTAVSLTVRGSVASRGKWFAELVVAGPLSGVKLRGLIGDGVAGRATHSMCLDLAVPAPSLPSDRAVAASLFACDSDFAPSSRLGTVASKPAESSATYPRLRNSSSCIGLW
jgi:hypothetical protein